MNPKVSNFFNKIKLGLNNFFGKVKVAFKKIFKKRKITRKSAIIIGAVSSLCLLIIGFGTAALVLGLTPKYYGMGLKYNFEDVFYIEYKNSYGTKQLFDKTEDLHKKPMQEIIKKLENGGKTNKLADLFGSKKEQTVVSNNDNSALSVGAFGNTYSNNSIIIWLYYPQNQLKELSHSEFVPVSNDYKAVSGDRLSPIYGLLIPLNKTSDKFQEQTWYLVTRNPYINTDYIEVSSRMTTYGNYRGLWKYVRGLDIKL
jgi:hypothetical protein